MPLIEYRCNDCLNTFEVIQKFSDPDPSGCSACGGSLERLLSAPSIRFKGAGWYVNDYAGKKSNGSTSDSTSKAESPKSKEPVAAKPETKSD